MLLLLGCRLRNDSFSSIVCISHLGSIVNYAGICVLSTRRRRCCQCQIVELPFVSIPNTSYRSIPRFDDPLIGDWVEFGFWLGCSAQRSLGVILFGCVL